MKALFKDVKGDVKNDSKNDTTNSSDLENILTWIHLNWYCGNKTGKEDIILGYCLIILLANSPSCRLKNEEIKYVLNDLKYVVEYLHKQEKLAGKACFFQNNSSGAVEKLVSLGADPDLTIKAAAQSASAPAQCRKS